MKRAALSLVSDSLPDPDRMHRALMGKQRELKDERARRRRAESDNAKLRTSLTALFKAWKTVADAQEELRRTSGLESPDDILRLAAGLSQDQFKIWIAELADRGV
jgi:hypothetical protein